MITRFAPSPTGPLHLGHAFSAITGHDLAKAAGGTFHLRIDDLDQSRSRAQWEAQALDDLRWLGLSWPEPLRRQNRHSADYTKAIETLAQRGLVYPCSCSRADVLAAATAPQEGDPPFGPDGVIYPGTCRERAFSDQQSGDALRLNMAKAVETAGSLPSFTEEGDIAFGQHALDAAALIDGVGDVVLRRKSGEAAYHLAVVIDDHDQGITHVVRGMDLFGATQIHVLIQRLLGLPSPKYRHHRLIRDEAGKRLAKRDDAKAIAKLRAEGASPQDIRDMVGL